MHFLGGLETHGEIGSRYGISRERVRQILIAAGVTDAQMREVRRKRHAFRQRAKAASIDIDAYRERYEAGESLRSLAADARIDHAILRPLLAEAGCELRSGTRILTPTQENDVFRRYARLGKSSVAIARDYGINYQVVLRIVRERGGRIRKPGPRPALAAAGTLSTSQEEEVARLYSEGMLSKADLAEGFEVEVATISLALKRQGVLFSRPRRTQ